MDLQGLGENVVETALGQAAGQRHLAALKPDADAAAGAGHWPFWPRPPVFPFPEPAPRPLRYALVVGAGGGESSCRFIVSAPPSSVFLGDLEQVADVGDLAPGSRVVGLHGGVADLVKAQGLGSRLDAWRCGRSGS